MMLVEVINEPAHEGNINCICDRPDGDEEEMVACDYCERWFHIKCVGEEAKVLL